jgi:hypothetical protein
MNLQISDEPVLTETLDVLENFRAFLHQTLQTCYIRGNATRLVNCCPHRRRPSPLRLVLLRMPGYADDTEQRSQDPVPASRLDASLQGRRVPDSASPQLRSGNRSGTHPSYVRSNPSIDEWLCALPEDKKFEVVDEMSLPPSKRSRSSDSLISQLSQSGDGTESTVSREKKYAAYRDVNYPVVLETKGSFMRSSEAGLVPEDKALHEELLHTVQTKPTSPLFNSQYDRFHSLLRGRSESRIYLDLHPLIVPSAENLFIMGRKEFEGLVEGHNDLWVKAVPFYGPRPQPDHTYGFKWSNFTEKERKKLNIDPSDKSYFTAREDIYFPFLTSEVKCGKQGLDLADRPNAHSMTIALRGIVELYRKANRAADVHQRVLGYSISHDEHNARIYAHYPEIDGDKTTYWRETIKELNLCDSQENWTPGQFTLNVCQRFAPKLLARLKSVINQLPDPTQPASELAGLDDLSVQISQDDASAPESQDVSFRKPRKAGGLHTELRTMIQDLQRQLEQQRREPEQQRREPEQQRREPEQQRKESEQQRKESEAQRAALVDQLERQRKELLTQMEEQQRKAAEQHKELLDLLKQRGEQMRKIMERS